MKYGLLAGLIASVLLFPGFQCKKSLDYTYKGRLEVKGICMNYTVKVLEGNIDTSKIQASWTDPTTNKTYTNVFAMASYCSFPTDIQEGEEFYFLITNKQDENCATCLAYYPTPQKRLHIKASKTPF